MRSIFTETNSVNFFASKFRAFERLPVRRQGRASTFHKKLKGGVPATAFSTNAIVEAILIVTGNVQAVAFSGKAGSVGVKLRGITRQLNRLYDRLIIVLRLIDAG